MLSLQGWTQPKMHLLKFYTQCYLELWSMCGTIYTPTGKSLKGIFLLCGYSQQISMASLSHLSMLHTWCSITMGLSGSISNLSCKQWYFMCTVLSAHEGHQSSWGHALDTRDQKNRWLSGNSVQCPWSSDTTKWTLYYRLIWTGSQYAWCIWHGWPDKDNWQNEITDSLTHYGWHTVSQSTHWEVYQNLWVL